VEKQMAMIDEKTQKPNITKSQSKSQFPNPKA